MAMISLWSNIASLRIQRQLGDSSRALSRTFERLSSGARINRASDDAAGLAIADSLRASKRVYSQAVRNGSDAISALNIAESTVSQFSSIITRLKELATQSASGAYSNTQREALQSEANALVSEYNRILDSATFNGRRVIEDVGGDLSVQLGYGTDGALTVSIGEKLGRLTGNGTFQTPQQVAAGSAFATGDFNGDGREDIVRLEGDRLFIDLNDGRGGYTNASATYIMGVATDNGVMTGRLQVGDFNGDGIADVVLAHDGALIGGFPSVGGIRTFLGNGAGSLTFKSQVSGQSTHIVVGDFNNDGRDDIARRAATNTISFYISDASGAMGAAVNTAIGGTGPLAAADFDGDGADDLAYAVGGSIRFFRYAAVPTQFHAIASGFVGDLTALTAADVNGDGRPDILAGMDGAGGSSTRIHLQQSATSYTFSQTLTGGAEIQVADINGDGHKDVVTISSGVLTGTGAGYQVSLGSGDGSFKGLRFANLAVPLTGIRISSANSDGDDALDLLGAQGGNIVLAKANTRTYNRMQEVDISTQSAARSALVFLDGALTRTGAEIGALGASLSRIEASRRHLEALSENTAAAEGRIRDADMAVESARLIRLQILQEAGAAVLSQANQAPDLALTLLALT